MHASRGHVAAVRGIADHMMAAAAEGKMPHIYETSDFLHASAQPVAPQASKELEEMKAQMKDLSASMATKLDDIKKQQFKETEAPVRKTVEINASKLPKSTHALLTKNGINPSDSEKLSVASVDKMLDGSKITRSGSFAAKLNLVASGLLDPSQSA